jgi:alginate O-acetyltransferase complex protein AlgI
VRYRDVAERLLQRSERFADVADGARRFVVGLGKKLLIADNVGRVADLAFDLPPSELGVGLAWLGVVCYALQIYFDFSGYSDMAIGLGRIFGFRFLENFQWPYASRSVTEFWRRWHISLSSWFRDYLYVPLGGNRRGRARTLVHLVVVFFLSGLWHGAAWSFVVWGLVHGLFLVIERAGLGRVLPRLPRVVGHAYALLVVVLAWVFFRAETLGAALDYFASLAGLVEGSGAHTVAIAFDARLGLALAAGIIGSVPWLPAVARWRERLAAPGGSTALSFACEAASALLLSLVFLASAMALSAGTYDPFIYFRF